MTVFSARSFFLLVAMAGCHEGNLPSSKARRVAVGYAHTCALTTEGIMACWGYGEHGELGFEIEGSESAELHQVVRGPTKIEGLDGITDFDTYSQHGCAVHSGGSVSCWGANTWGQVGNGSTDHQMTPAKVEGLSDIESVRTGCDFSCALTTEGGVKCWGNNDFFQLGAETSEPAAPSLTPIDVTGLSSGAVSIATGCDHACAVMGDGTLECWGNNSSGQAGQKIKIDRHTSNKLLWIDTPTVVPDLSDVAEVALTGDSTCALLSGGAMKCWGSQAGGLLGNGKNIDEDFDNAHVQIAPADVTGLTSGVTTISGTCAVVGGPVECWSYNLGDGTVGDGTDGSGVTSNVPVRVKGVKDAVQVSAGLHSCLVTRSGAVQCWGTNEFGQLGNGHDAYIDLPGQFYEVAPVDVISFP